MEANSFRGKVGFVFHLVAICSFLFSVSIPSWIEGEIRGDGIRLGIWSLCLNDYCMSLCDVDSNYAVKEILGGEWLTAAQVSTSIALALSIFSLLMVLTYFSIYSKDGKQVPLQLAIFVLCVSITFFVIIELVFYAETNDIIQQYELPTIVKLHHIKQPSVLFYSHSFYLLIAGICFAILGSLYYILEYRYATSPLAGYRRIEYISM